MEFDTGEKEEESKSPCPFQESMINLDKKNEQLRIKSTESKNTDNNFKHKIPNRKSNQKLISIDINFVFGLLVIAENQKCPPRFGALELACAWTCIFCSVAM